MRGHSLDLATGSRAGAKGWASTDPPPTGQGMLQGSACSLLGTALPRSETTHSCVLPLMQAPRWLQGLDEHAGAPVPLIAGREEMAPSLVPEPPSEEMPALVLGRGYGSHTTQLLKPEPFSQQARSTLSLRLQHLCPCTKA